MPNPYTYTDSAEVVASYLYTLLSNAAGSFTPVLDTTGKGVMYGDQSLLPTTPCLCVVPANTNTAYNGVGGRPVMNTYITYVMVYYGKLQDQQVNIHTGLALAQQVRQAIHADATLGGNVIDALCAVNEPGIARRGGTLLEATRITVQSRAKVVLNP